MEKLTGLLIARELGLKVNEGVPVKKTIADMATPTAWLATCVRNLVVERDCIASLIYIARCQHNGGCMSCNSPHSTTQRDHCVVPAVKQTVGQITARSATSPSLHWDPSDAAYWYRVRVSTKICVLSTFWRCIIGLHNDIKTFQLYNGMPELSQLLVGHKT